MLTFCSKNPRLEFNRHALENTYCAGNFPKTLGHCPVYFRDQGSRMLEVPPKADKFTAKSTRSAETQSL